MKYGSQDMVEPDDIYITVCSMCGYPLKGPEIAARFVGCLIDATDPFDFAPACLDFCSECVDKILQFTKEEINVAIRRMEDMKEANGK